MDSFTLDGEKINPNDPWITEVSQLNIRLISGSYAFTFNASFCAELPTVRETIERSVQRTGTMTKSLGKSLNPDVLESVLYFCVNRKIDITDANVLDILLVAEVLQHTQLMNACLAFLTEKINVTSVTRLHINARQYGIHSLAEVTSRFIRKSFEEYCTSDDLLHLPFTYLKDIIAEKELKVSREDSVLEAVMRWCKYSCPGNAVVLAELLSKVRKSVSDACVQKVLQDPPTTDPVKNESVREVIRKHFSEGDRRGQREFSEYELFALCQDYYYVYVHAYDIDKDQWWAISMKECIGEMYCALTVNGNIWTFYKNRIEVSSEGAHVWKRNIKMEIFDSEAIVFYENKLYFFGVYSRYLKGRVRIVNIAGIPKFEKTQHMPTVRHYSAAVALGECIYVTGGYRTLSLFLSSVSKYSPTRNVWHSGVAPMITGRAYHSCACTDSRIYVCGGRTLLIGFLRTCEMYDVVANQWTVIRNMCFGREKPSMVCNRGLLGIFGGQNEPSSNIMEVYYPVANKWKWGYINPAHLKHCAVIFSDRN